VREGGGQETNSDQNPEAEADPDTDPQAHTNPDAHPDRHRDEHSNVHVDPHGHADRDLDADSLTVPGKPANYRLSGEQISSGPLPLRLAAWLYRVVFAQPCDL